MFLLHNNSYRSVNKRNMQINNFSDFSVKTYVVGTDDKYPSDAFTEYQQCMFSWRNK